MNNLSVCFTDDLEEGRTLYNPTFMQVENLILQLNQDIKYYMEIIVGDIDDDNKMTIGGGAGNYLVSIIQGDILSQLINLDGNDESDILLYVGQEAEYPSSWVVNLEEAISAAKFYYDNQEANPTQKWEKW